jgi:hypothetical protein
MSGDDAKEFLAALGPQDRAQLANLSAEIKAMTPEQQLEIWREITRWVVESRKDKRSMQ